MKGKKKGDGGVGFWSMSRSEWKRGKKPKWTKLDVFNKLMVFGLVEAVDPKKPREGIRGNIAVGNATIEFTVTYAKPKKTRR